jgi:large subunit ribosomal protein L9
MKVILQKDVKNVGKVGDIVSVATGYARNFLLPNRLAAIAQETSVKAWAHIKQVAERKKVKALTERKELLQKIASVTLLFKVASGENGKIFGSVTTHEISKALEEKGFSVDRRDIKSEPIRVLGQHKVTISYGTDLSCEVTVAVEKA